MIMNELINESVSCQQNPRVKPTSGVFSGGNSCFVHMARTGKDESNYSTSHAMRTCHILAGCVFGVY